jgi:hypothetical protein
MDAFQAATQRSAPPPALLFLFGTPDERAQPAPPTTPRAASGNAEYDPLYCCVPFLCSALLTGNQNQGTDRVDGVVWGGG